MPLEFMFPKVISRDKNGVVFPLLPARPTRYELARLDAVVRKELLLADLRQGADFGMATIIREVVVGMMYEFCVMVRRVICYAG